MISQMCVAHAKTLSRNDIMYYIALLIRLKKAHLEI